MGALNKKNRPARALLGPQIKVYRRALTGPGICKVLSILKSFATVSSAAGSLLKAGGGWKIGPIFSCPAPGDATPTRGAGPGGPFSRESFPRPEAPRFLSWCNPSAG